MKNSTIGIVLDIDQKIIRMDTPIISWKINISRGVLYVFLNVAES